MHQPENQIIVKFDALVAPYIKAPMSITTALIHSTIDKIKKDLYQLEDWLNSLHSGSHPSSYQPSLPSNPNVSDLMKKIEELTNEVSAQKHTIHHLIDRIDVMEETREIHIDEHLEQTMEYPDPWLSGPTPLQNEIIEPTVVNIHKSEDFSEVKNNVESSDEEETVEETQEQKEAQEEKQVESKEQKEEVQEEEVEEAAEEEQEEEQEDAVKQEDPKEEQAEEEQAEEEQAEEEEEGVELEEIIVKGVHYYKDPEEGFIYEIDAEGQPSDQPIGVWKTKTQTISFYRST